MSVFRIKHGITPPYRYNIKCISPIELIYLFEIQVTWLDLGAFFFFDMVNKVHAEIEHTGEGWNGPSIE